MDKITKLSQAIRLGSTIRPQTRWRMFGLLMDGRVGSCALGAAYEALNPNMVEDVAERLNGPISISAIDDLAKRFPKAPFMHITIWNDSGGLTREQIADRLESLGH